MRQSLGRAWSIWDFGEMIDMEFENMRPFYLLGWVFQSFAFYFFNFAVAKRSISILRVYFDVCFMGFEYFVHQLAALIVRKLNLCVKSCCLLGFGSLFKSMFVFLVVA